MKCCGVDTYKDWAEYDSDYFSPYNTPLINLTDSLSNSSETTNETKTALDHLLQKIGDSFSYQKNR